MKLYVHLPGIALSEEARKDIHNSDIPVLCRSCEARHKGVCGALSEKQLVDLNKSSNQRTVEAGTPLLHSGDPIDHYANIVGGVVRLSKMMEDGRQQIVGLQFAPDFLGRPLGRETQVSADAATDVKVCSFPKTVLDRMMRETPELEHKLLEQSLRELDEAREWMLTIGRKTAREKVASFLLLISAHADPESDEQAASEFDLPLRRSDIADFLGLTIETVSRQLSRLRQAGIIEIENNRHVTVPDLEALQREAGA